MEEKRKYFHKESFLRPIWIENPLFVLVLGTCPALAITKTFEASFGMGILFTFVLVFSNIIISALRKVIPDEVHIPCYIVIIATFVTITKMMTEAFLPELFDSLGVFLALLVVNCIVLGRAEAFANKNTVGDSLLDGLGNGLGFTIAICIIGIIREILGTGMLTFGNIFTFLKIGGKPFSIPILKAVTEEGKTIYDFSISLFNESAGGFIVFGIIMAIIAAVENHKKELARQKALEEKKKQAAMKAQQAQPAAGGEQK